MKQSQIIAPYYMAENDQGKVLITFADQGAEVKEVTYKMKGGDLILNYDDGRSCLLKQLNPAQRPVVERAQSVLIVEHSKESLVRAYDARNIEAPVKRRPRKRLL